MFAPPLLTPNGRAVSPRCGTSSPPWSPGAPSGWSSTSSVSSSDSPRPVAATPPPPPQPSLSRVALPPTEPLPLPPLAPPQPSLQLPGAATGGVVSRRPRPVVGPVWSPSAPLASSLSSPLCSTDSVLIDFARDAAEVTARSRDSAEEEEEEEGEITAVVRRPPASAPPAAAAASPDAWTCELWEDDVFEHIELRSSPVRTAHPRRPAGTRSAVPSHVASTLLAPTPAEAVLVDAHREVASQVDVLQTVRSTFVSLMYLAAGRAAP